MTLPTFHIWHDTPQGRLPFTLFVFGPYTPFSGGTEFDVEIYSGHIVAKERMGSNYVGTVSDLSRDTHIIQDVWNDLDRMTHSNDFVYSDFDMYGDIND